MEYKIAYPSQSTISEMLYMNKRTGELRLHFACHFIVDYCDSVFDWYGPVHEFYFKGDKLIHFTFKEYTKHKWEFIGYV
jgi:hypothetical protein